MKGSASHIFHGFRNKKAVPFNAPHCNAYLPDLSAALFASLVQRHRPSPAAFLHHLQRLSRRHAPQQLHQVLQKNTEGNAPRTTSMVAGTLMSSTLQVKAVIVSASDVITNIKPWALHL